jgi:hypothetical protein
MLGDAPVAIRVAEQSVTYADRSGDEFRRMVNHCSMANALHQAGHRTKAERGFQEAERLPAYPLLHGLEGFRYCDLLLTEAEIAAWQMVNRSELRPLERNAVHRATLLAVSERAAQTLRWVKSRNLLLHIAMDHLSLGRSALYAAILQPSVDVSGQRTLRDAVSELDAAVVGLRHANRNDYLPCALLSRSWLRCYTSARTDTDSARTDLDEARDIAERGPMRLHLADIHLHRARLFFREKSYPWKSPQADLAAAEKLINDCGYHRRDQELADAKRAILGVESDSASSAPTFHESALRPTPPSIRQVPRVGRNDPCPCGSGKKFKACCGR